MFSERPFAPMLFSEIGFCMASCSYIYIDQLQKLVLLGQLEIAKNPEGMLVTFLDFSKVYDKVDRKSSGHACTTWELMDHS